MLGCGRFSFTPYSAVNARYSRRCCSKSATPRTNTQFRANYGHQNSNGNGDEKKKVVIFGSGWAALGAAHHLCNQGFDVTVLQEGSGFSCPDDVGIQGFWSPYKNIFNLVDDLGIKPFTYWLQSAQYSRDGLEIEFPVFQDMPQLPTPLGPLFYSQFTRLPVLDRLTSLPLMTAVIDFDNTDVAWRRYDPTTARELFKQFGCSERLYRDVFGPLLQVGLFAPAEQCSAAATLGMLYYISLAHQKDFDAVWCRGAVREKIFDPWMDSMSSKGCQFIDSKIVTDLVINEETGCILQVICGSERFNIDAVIFAVGIRTIQELVKNSAALLTKDEFLKALNLAAIDVVTTKLWLDRKVLWSEICSHEPVSLSLRVIGEHFPNDINTIVPQALQINQVKIPKASNACAALDDSLGWTFFDLNVLHDKYKSSPVTILQADFYHASELLPLTDEQVATKAISYLSNCIEDFKTVTVMEKEVARFPKSLTHFFPGSYKYMMRGSTSFPNLFMAGDWIITRHGSWSQEKSYVTGLEAANRAVDFLGEGSFAKIIPVEEDEPHVQALRNLNRSFKEFSSQLPLSDYFLQ